LNLLEYLVHSPLLTLFTFLVLNFSIDENPYKDIYLTSFRVFLPKFMAIVLGNSVI